MALPESFGAGLVLWVVTWLWCSILDWVRRFLVNSEGGTDRKMDGRPSGFLSAPKEVPTTSISVEVDHLSESTINNGHPYEGT